MALAGILAANGYGAVCYSPPTGLVGWWGGDGDAKDLSGTNHGVIQAGATAAGAGVVGLSFTFDGTNGYVQIADAAELRPTTLTIEAWARFDALDSSGNASAGLQYLVFKQNSRLSNFEGFSLAKGRVSGLDYLMFAMTSATGQSVLLASLTTVSTGVWYHVACVRGSNFAQIYVNGQLEAQSAATFALDYGNYPLLFGSTGQASWDRKLKGSLDEVSLYNRALTATEIAAIYSAGSTGKCKPLHFVVNPQSQAVVAGRDVTFTAAASGNPPFGYQWRCNNTNLTGAIGTNLTLTFVQPTNGGDYSVVVTNASGVATSAVAVLTVLVSPKVTAHPQNRTNAAGTTATFNVTATGTPLPGFRWRFNGANLSDNARISGSASNMLAISNVQSSDAGNYSVLATNAAGLGPSALATLTVLVPPSIAVQPGSVAVLVGANVNFAVSASGTPPLSYQWFRNGSAMANAALVSGVASPVLKLTAVKTNDAANYDVVITNVAGGVTSQVATLGVTLVPMPPSIVTQPISRVGNSGDSVVFSVVAGGTVPLSYQWRKGGVPLLNNSNLAGATNDMLTVSGVTTNEAGAYQVVITNVAGGATSSVASLVVNPPVKLGVDAAVLVNSTSAKYLDFQHYIQPYLDNFGVPYTVFDLATNGLGTNIGRYALIIVGHKQLDTNHLFLATAAQALLAAAVLNGTGLVNFDNDLALGATTPRYQFVQDIFGFTYGTSAAAGSVSFPATEAQGQMHYITALHPTNETMALSNSMSVAGLTLASNSTAVALSAGRPLVVASKYGRGRAVQWSSYDWVSASVQGPVNGLDDLVWRSLVWAARKPFVMRGLPNFVAMRIDDCAGPFDWVHIANEVGFKPFLALFIADIAGAHIPDLRALITNGNATASIHSFTGSTMFYFDHEHGASYSDMVMSNNFYIGTQWHLANGIPFSKNVIAHYSEIGPNAFAGLKAWGVEFVPIEVVPGTVEYGTPPAPWLVAGPYRRFDPPQAGESNLPLYYADFLRVPGHPELDGQFFNRYTEIRDTAAPGAFECGEWCPSNDVQGSTNRATRQIKRALDSRVLASLFSHEWYIQNTPSVGNGDPITTANWRAILQGITNNIGRYNPSYVTTEYADQYVRATRTSRLLSADLDLGSGRVTAVYLGAADMATSLETYVGDGGAISNLVSSVPAFSGSLVATGVPLVLPPIIFSSPSSLTSAAGDTAVFSVGAGGPGPLTYRWYRNGTNALTDGTKITGSAGPTLKLNDVLGADGAVYALVIAGPSGSVTSSPALLKVIDPVFVSQPSSRTNHAGTTAVFDFVARGTGPAYQWLKGGVLVTGATSTSLTLPAVSDADAGVYSVIVSNAYGSLTSGPASLTVAAPLLIRSFAVSQSVAFISWNAIPGRDYVLQRRSQLFTTNWNSLAPPVHATNSIATISDAGGLPSGRYYRVMLEP